MTQGKIEPHHLDSLAALIGAQSTKLRKQKDERDSAFVKRIVCAYMNAHNASPRGHDLSRRLPDHPNGEIKADRGSSVKRTRNPPPASS